MQATPQPSPPAPESEDLDARIRQVEQRLIAREEALRLGIESFGQRLRHKLHAGRNALPAAGGVVGMLLLGGVLWWKWRRPSVAASTAGDGAAEHGRSGEMPWVRLVALAWPMLPQAWRSRISPATASTLAAIGLPLIERLLHGRRLAPLATMPFVDLARFSGHWHVLAQLPRPGPLHAGLAGVAFRPRADGDLDALATSPQDDDPGRAGIARIERGSGGARLRFSVWPHWLRWLPLAWLDLGIVHVDEAYGEALVGSSDRQHLWLLARRPLLPTPRLQLLLQLAADQGFAVERLQQADGTAAFVPDAAMR